MCFLDGLKPMKNTSDGFTSRRGERRLVRKVYYGRNGAWPSKSG